MDAVINKLPVCVVALDSLLLTTAHSCLPLLAVLQHIHCQACTLV